MSVPYYSNDGSAAQIYGLATWPPGVYDPNTDTTWFVWDSYSPTNGLRGTRIRGFDHALGRMLPARSIATHPLVDDTHGVPSMQVDHEGHLHVFGGGHNSAVFHYSSDAAGDHTAWTLQHTFSGEYSYPRPQVVGTKLVLQLRENNTPATKMPLVYFATTALSGGSATWGSESALLDLGTDSRAYGGSTHVDGVNLHFVATRANYADSERKHVYHLVLNTTTGAVTNSDGSVTIAAGDLPVDLTEANTSFRVYQHTGGNLTCIPSLAPDTSNELHIVFADGSTNPVTLKHTRFTAGAWISPASIGVGTDLGASGTHVSEVALATLSDGEMAVYYTEDDADDWDWGGNIRSVVRSAGGSWGSSTLIAEAVDRAYHMPSAVANAHEDARVIFCQRGQDSESDAAGFDFRAFAYGDGGFLLDTEAAQTLSRTTSGIIDFFDLNGAPDQWRSFAAADWTVGAGNAKSVTAVTGGDALVITRSGAGSASIGFVRLDTVSSQGSACLFARMVRIGDSRIGIAAHISDLTASSEDGLAIHVRNGAVAALSEVTDAVVTSLDVTPGNVAVAEQNYSFAAFFDGADVVGWDEASNRDWAGTAVSHATGQVGVWRSADVVGAAVRVRQFFALTSPSLTVNGLETGDTVELRAWDHSVLASAAESGGTATLDLLKVAPNGGVQLVVVDDDGDRIVYERTPGSGEFIVGGSTYSVAQLLTLTVEPGDEWVSLGVPSPVLGVGDFLTETRWLVTTLADIGFETPVVDVTSLVDLLTHLAEGLTPGTAYRAQALVYSDQLGLAAVSTVGEFVTIAAPTAGDTPTLIGPPSGSPALTKAQDFIEVEISAYNHADGEVEPSAFDELNPKPWLAVSEIQIRLTADGNWSTPDDQIDVVYLETTDSRRARFEGLTAGTSYTFRGRQLDGHLATYTAYSADLVVSTDATPVNAPAKPTTTLVSCARSISLTGSAFSHPAGGTHAGTDWIICIGSACQTIHTTDPAKLLAWTWQDVPPPPAGEVYTLKHRYKDNSGKYGATSDGVTCDPGDYPPQATYTSPPLGSKISTNTVISWEFYDPNAVGWRSNVRRSGDAGTTWTTIATAQVGMSTAFTIAGFADQDYIFGVQAQHPTTGETGEWAEMPLTLDRNNSQRVYHVHFADYDSDAEVAAAGWRQFGSGPEHVSFRLRDSHDPVEDVTNRVGLMAKTTHTGTTVRYAAFVNESWGEPDEFDLMIACEQIPNDCQWPPHRFSNASQTRGGSAILATVESWRLSLIAWGQAWYLGGQMTCVSDSYAKGAAAFTTKHANLSANLNKSFRYGRTMGTGSHRTVTNRTDTALLTHTSQNLSSSTSPRSGGPQIYVEESGVLGLSRQIFNHYTYVRRASSGGNPGWNITTRIAGPGASLTTSPVFVRETDGSGKSLVCGCVGLGFQDMDKIGLGRSEGILFTDIRLRVLSYGACEAIAPPCVEGTEAVRVISKPSINPDHHEIEYISIGRVPCPEE